MDEKVRQRQALFELREKTLGQILDETVARIPDKEAIVYADRNYRQTWREFADTVDLFAKGLMALGVQKGEKVAVWASNVPYWVALQFATAKIGAILITVNTNYREHELEYLLNQSECENIFIMDSLRDHDYIDTLYTLAPELRYQSRDRLSFARLPHLRRVCFLGAEKHRGMYSVPEILSMSVMTDDAEYQARQDSLDPWDAINMQYTSGTTGFPKGVMLTHVGVGLNGYWIPCRSSTASAACWASRPASTTGPAWSSSKPTTPCMCWPPWTANAARPCTACPPCSWPSWNTRCSSVSTSPACARASWPVPSAPSRSCGAWWRTCT